METNFITNINEADKNKIILLIDASIQAYNAFETKRPEQCLKENITPPEGFEFVECWSGIDSIFGHEKTIENYGVVFRSKKAPYTYVFAFRGTASAIDILDDLGVESKQFKPFDTKIEIAPGVEVESGFYDIYTSSEKETSSMQTQVFQLLDKYQSSDKPVHQLYITGHSLGAALSTLFTLDVALSRPNINASNINFASPRVGNSSFVEFYIQQAPQLNPETRTLRVQNTYDKVPCVPPEFTGYQHLPSAYLVAFYKDSFSGKFDFVDSHSSANYFEVIKCAAASVDGICVCEKLEVPENNYAVTSTKPDISKICSLF